MTKELISGRSGAGRAGTQLDHGHQEVPLNGGGPADDGGVQGVLGLPERLGEGDVQNNPPPPSKTALEILRVL